MVNSPVPCVNSAEIKSVDLPANSPLKLTEFMFTVAGLIALSKVAEIVPCVKIPLSLGFVETTTAGFLLMVPETKAVESFLELGLEDVGSQTGVILKL